MGTGGATALLSPEADAALAVSLLSQRRNRETESLVTRASAAGDALQFLRGQRPRLQHFQKNMIFNRQSQIENPHFFWFSDIYIQVFGKFRGQRPRLQL